MQVGSEAHKELYCRAFLEGHRKYEPEDLPWPDLQGDDLKLIQGIPFWDHALQAEADAGPMVKACAEVATDPLIREALALQGYEEERHGRTIQHMIDRYEIEINEIHVEMPPNVEEAFIDFGFEECLDSFGAFGLFELARRSQLVPRELFEIFDQVMQEEAHHIVFFINWFAHRQINRGLVAGATVGPKAAWHYAKALSKLGGIFFGGDSDEGEDFVVTGAAAFVDNLTPSLVLETSLTENERRLAGFDRDLLRPNFVPRVARTMLPVLKLLPFG
ncbi:MAG: ferritin-like domain-containing protein [Deltaproteobacteria bacterium]|nr:ferritin-like domain-containing protein [Deltaproteobacteria bacterium]MBW2416902.1 ferritin-like domain-containing protein [Deltaproteobacteria bacterium]